MNKNKYDDPVFFEKYSGMDRSVRGLAGAGEWQALQKMLPDFAGKRVLDLGCGFGWHCVYAARHGAASVLGVDLSAAMLARAETQTQAAGFPQVAYRRAAIEAVSFEAGRFDAVLSSLALHYVVDLPALYQKIHRWLAPGGDFVFSIEHPVFTAQGGQDWLCGPDGEVLCWPVDSYFTEGGREAVFLGERVPKQHHTLTTILGGLLSAGFELTGVVEPQPPPEMLAEDPAMAEELRRPMMLLVAARRG